MVRVCDKNAPLTQKFFLWVIRSPPRSCHQHHCQPFLRKGRARMVFLGNRILTPQFEDDFGINPYLNQVLILDVSDWLYHVNICGTN